MNRSFPLLCRSTMQKNIWKKSLGSIWHQTFSDFETHLMKIRDLLVLLRNYQVETQINLDIVFWVFTRFTLSALEAGTSLEIIRKEELFARYLKHRFGPLGIKKKVLTGILQSNNAFIIKPAVCLIGFIKQYLPVVFAKVKK